MARQLEIAKVINIVQLVNSFNDNLWTNINSNIGGKLHSNDPAGTALTDDTYTDEAGKVQTITSAGVPQFPVNGYIGDNVSSSNRTVPVKDALPPSHLRTLRGKGRQFYTLKWQDISDKQTGTIINADAVYNACYAVLYRLITIRPIYSTWVHETTNVKSGYGGFTKSWTFYGVYKRSDLEDSSALNSVDTSSKAFASDIPKAYYKWESYAKGANFSIFSATDEDLTDSEKALAVGRNNCVEGIRCLASNINKEVQTFWNAWSSKCLNKNRFTYRYHSCHMSCHSSCWCHSSRGRR